MNSINTNIGALSAQKAMNDVTKELNTAMQRLSSGLRINSAKDDAAGSAIASRMEATVRSLDVAIRNGGDAVSMTQTAEGALGEMENILQRMRELSVQASNSTLNTTDRSSIQKEVDALTKEIDNIANNTNFNGVKLLNGSVGEVNFQIGINEKDGLSISLGSATTTALGLNSYTSTDGSLSSGRVTGFDYSGANLAASDIKINGKDGLAAALTTDLSANAAGALKTAINANSSVHGSIASAYNTVTGNAFEDGSLTMTIEGVSITATGGKDLVAQTNEKVAGVTALLNDNGTITLSNTTGDDIVIGQAKAGFEATTYTGFIKLKNVDASEVSIQTMTKGNGFSADNGTITDIQRLGFNETDVAGAYEGKAVNATSLTTDDTVKVNGIAIGTSTNGTATAKASAINQVTADTGVTATAFTQVDLSLDFTKARDAAANEAVGFVLTGASAVANKHLTFSDGTAAGTFKAVHATDLDTTAANLVTAVNASGLYTASYTAATDKFVITAGESTTADTGQTFTSSGVTKANLTMTTGGILEKDTFTFDTTGGLLDSIGERIEISDGSQTITVDLKDVRTTTQDLKGEVLAIFATSINAEFDSVTATVAGDTIVLESKTPGTALATFTMQSVNTTTSTLVAGIEKTAAAADVHETHLIDVSGSTIVNGNFMSFSTASAGLEISVAFDTNATTTADNLVAAINSDATHAALYTASNTAGKITIVSTKGNVSIGNAGDIDVNIKVPGPLIDAVKANTLGNTAATSVAQDATQAVTAGVPAISINGVALNVSDDVSVATLITEINGKSLGDITASSTSEGKLRLTSASGADITLIDDDTTANATTGFITAGTDSYGASITAGTFGTEIDDAGITTSGRIKLTSADSSPVVLDGLAASLTKLGLAATGGSELKSGSGLSMSNTANSASAITSIDAAISKISSLKSNFGAVENRVDAAVSNLETLKLNTTAAKSRIEDADFATETSNLTKGQILSQAATTMLAQANASKQNLLALLQG